MAEHFPAPWGVDPLTATVYANDVPKGPARVADMRGWGYLTGRGHGALALSEDEAIDIQRANAAFIVKAVNCHDEMLAALLNVRKIIADGAMTGFNCHDGDWADRLFQSQQVTSAAIKSASYSVSSNQRGGE